ncbi:BREX-1 system adenine-specific DNA-methyltransferase PglX, partial [Lacticaseibacillus baoqingensis]
SADLFSVFIWHNINMTKVNGYAGYMTPFVWMFIKSYEKLRTALLSNVKIDSLIQLEYSAFEEATVPINTFVLKNTKNDETGTYLRLSDFKGGMMIQAEKVQEAIADPGVKYLYRTNQTNFKKLPGTPIAYWASAKLIHVFTVSTPIGELWPAQRGLTTGNNAIFLRYWWEPSFDNIGRDKAPENAQLTNCKWFPYNKGGTFRRWYGNRELVVNYWKNGECISQYGEKSGRTFGFQGSAYYFQAGITWTALTSSKNSFRYSPEGSIFDSNKGPMMFPDKERLYYVLGLLSSKVSGLVFSILNPTISLQNGDVNSFPYIFQEDSRIIPYVKTAIKLVKLDWDATERSWDFSFHPLFIAEHNPLTIWLILLFTCLIRITSSPPSQTMAT